MTAAELIARLKRLDPTTVIMVQGYEDGLTEVDDKRIFLAKVALDCMPEQRYYGRHNIINSHEGERALEANPEHPTCMALILRR